MRALAIVLGLGLGLALAPAAHAERPLAQLLAVGDDAFEHGFYGDALGAYQDAYQLSQQAPLLLKIGSCYEHLKNWWDAAAAYRKYLEVEPSLSAGERANLSSKATALEARAHPAPPPAPPAVQAAAPVPAPPSGRVVALRRAVVGSAIATVAVAVVAAGVTIAAADGFSRLASDCRSGAAGCSNDARDRVSALDHSADAMWSLAAAGAITTLALHLVLRHERQLHAQVAPTAGGARVQVGFSF